MKKSTKVVKPVLPAIKAKDKSTQKFKQRPLAPKPSAVVPQPVSKATLPPLKIEQSIRVWNEVKFREREHYKPVKPLFADKLNYPESAIGTVQIMEEAVGVGTMVGPRMVLTAGYALLDIREMRSVRPSPADICFVAEGVRVPVVSYYLSSRYNLVDAQANNFNFAVLILGEDIGYRTGWLGMAPLATQDLLKCSLELQRQSCPISQANQYYMSHSGKEARLGCPVILANKPDWLVVVGINVQKGKALKLFRQIYYEIVANISFKLFQRPDSMAAYKARVQELTGVGEEGLGRHLFSTVVEINQYDSPEEEAFKILSAYYPRFQGLTKSHLDRTGTSYLRPYWVAQEWDRYSQKEGLSEFQLLVQGQIQHDESSSSGIQFFINTIKFFALYPFSKFTQLDLGGKLVDFREFKKCGVLSNLTYLDLSRNYIGPDFEGFNWLYQLGQLTYLDLSYCKLSNEGMLVLSNSRYLSVLLYLDISANGISGEGLEHFAKCDFLSELETFKLALNRVGIRGGVALQDCTFLAKIKELDLYNQRLQDAGVHAFTKCKFFKSLKLLNLGKNYLTDKALSEFPNAHFLGTLETLILRENPLREGVRFLANCGFLKGLKKLDLQSCKLSYGTFQLLKDCYFMTGLKQFNVKNNPLHGLNGYQNCRFLEILSSWDLSNCLIGDEGFATLCSKDYLSQATSLTLSGCKITGKGLAQIKKCKFFKWLVTLDLSDNEIDYIGTTALAKCTFFDSLANLYLHGNKIDNEGITKLAEAPFIKSIKVLTLHGNLFDDAGLEAFRDKELSLRHFTVSGLGEKGVSLFKQCEGLHGLRKLDFRQFRLTGELIKTLFQVPFFNLTQLNLRQNLFRHNIDFLVDAKLPKLTELDLSYNYIGGSMGKTLEQCAWLWNLLELNLESNQLGRTGLKQFSQMLFLENLSSLNLANNEIGYEGMQQLSKCFFLRNLKSLNLNSNFFEYKNQASLLGECSFLVSLAQLRLDLNFISSDSIEAWHRAAFLSNLKLLSLAQNKLKTAAVEAFRHCYFLQNLTTLNLSRNFLNVDSLKVLRDCTFLKNVEELNLSYNNFEGAGVGQLAECSFFRKVDRLNLEGNILFKEGIRNLFSKHTFGGVSELNLKGCSIGWEGMTTLCENKWICNLRVLNVVNNDINDRFLKSFQRSRLQDTLEELFLHYNNISSIDVEAIAKAYPAIRIHHS